MYPNPVVDQLTVQFKEDKNRTITLKNIAGQIMLSQKITTQKQTLSLAELAVGIYFLEIKSKDELKSIKVIKQ